ncbi:MAG: hypothetical protein RBS38_03410 [Bacteroidales bacterium]|jgi:hypothetical protein|nr:hypothetical protein [Bacteroidales bacterium]
MRHLFFILTTLAVILTGNKLTAQILTFSAGAGTGTYNMKQLKDLNEALLLGEVPFETKIVSDFPPFPNYSASLGVRIKNVRYGLEYSYVTTGSRASSRDYIGEFLLDMTMNGHSAGMLAGFYLPSSGKLELSVSGVSGVIFTWLRINENLVVLEDQMLDVRFRMRSMVPYAGPVIGISYPEGIFNFGLNAGYLFQITKGSFKPVNGNDVILLNPSTQKSVGPGWDGFRIGLTAGVRFGGNQD